jgi:hypothetical protein
MCSVPLSERVRAQGINPVGTDIDIETGKRVSAESDGVIHDEWCPINGCRCGKCGPCLGPPLCVVSSGNRKGWTQT